VHLRRSALANVTYALAVAGVPRPQRLERAQAALARGRIAHLARAPARVLSGGEQQLLAIARTLATEPEILFLDEPTSALDPAATTAIEDLLGEVRAQGVGIVLITHDLGQARRLADEVAFMHRGRVLERTRSEEFFAQPRSPEAQAFVSGELVL
jgi:tungstate transport system ATP-binding protein